MSLRNSLTLAIITLMAAAPVLQSQEVADPAANALRTCSTMLDQKKTTEAALAGREAEAHLRPRMTRNPRDVEIIVGLARALSQCQLPAAEMMAQGELSSQAIELLENALSIDPNHWTARFILASINFRSPSFLGRAPRAATELDILLKQQGDRTENPRFARVFEMRGLLFKQAGKADSARITWTKGATLFPGDSTLVDLARRNAAPATSSAPTAPTAQLTAVSVFASSSPPPTAPSTKEVSKARILSVAGAGADVLQAVQLQPGATRVTEGSDIYTRGGDPAETALFVDGSRVAGLSRFEGLNGGMFGAIEPFVVRSVRYSSGGFSVRHGNALSGVVEIETDGRPRERQVRAGLSLVQASSTVRLPMNKTSGLWINARMSQTAALLATHGRGDEFEGAPHSEEVVASYITAPSPTSEVRVTALIEQDAASRIVDAAQWRGAFHSAGHSRTVMTSSRWLAPNSPVVIRTNLSLGDRSSDWEFGVLSRQRSEQSGVARADVEWSHSEPLTIRAGMDAGLFARRESGRVPTTNNVAPDAPSRALDDSRASAGQGGGYAELQYAFDATTVTVGTRADRLPGLRHVTVDPRFNVATKVGAWTARFAAGLFHQGAWRTAPVIPDSATPSGMPTAAIHLVAGVEREGSAGTLHGEIFNKKYSNYQVLGVGPMAKRSNVRGLDVIASRKQGSRINGSVAYSWLDARVTLADGRVIRSAFDITHSATGTVTTAVNSDWSLGQTLRYGTGAPRTANGSANLMGAKLADYARLDMRVMRYIRQPKYLLTTFAELINVTNRHNVSGMTFDPSQRREVPIHSFFASRTVVVGGEFQFR
jgi:hypothetical protein